MGVALVTKELQKALRENPKPSSKIHSVMIGDTSTLMTHRKIISKAQ